jgi:hypothetical protein
MANLIDDNKPLRPPAFPEMPKAGDVLATCRALLSETCMCRKRKKARNAFCLDCYLRLPLAMQKALWRRVGHGFEEAYATAKEYLLG